MRTLPQRSGRAPGTSDLLRVVALGGWLMAYVVALKLVARLLPPV